MVAGTLSIVYVPIYLLLKEMPIVTKWLFALSFGLTLGANFGLVNPMYIVLSFPDVFHNFEV